jgi:hypothetical protein
VSGEVQALLAKLKSPTKQATDCMQDGKKYLKLLKGFESKLGYYVATGEEEDGSPLDYVMVKNTMAQAVSIQ